MMKLYKPIGTKSYDFISNSEERNHQKEIKEIYYKLI